ncbi:MAG: polyphosphate kinase 1 [Spirochaetales bacterium]|nr:polyphosphate kinase 1 [Spirochaetales bacterium]
MAAHSANSRYINKEISWLSFNERVLQEAADKSVPLGDRIRFMGIYSNNLDEFFRTRVANLKHLSMLESKTEEPVMGDPAKALQIVYDIVLAQSGKFEKYFEQLREELKEHGVFFVEHTDLNGDQRDFVSRYFHNQVRPRVFPMILDRRYKMPFIKDRALYLAVRLKCEGKSPRFSIIEVPTRILPRFLLIPGESNRRCVMFIDDVLRFGFPSLFRMLRFDSYEAYAVKVTRDAELALEDDLSVSYMNKISTSLEKRSRGEPIRFVYDRSMPSEMLDFFVKKLRLKDSDILVPGGRYHYFRDFMSFDKVLDLPHVNRPPAIQEKALSRQRRILRVIAEQDVFLHFPYQSFNYVLDLLREASIDPRVESIKITLYRLAENSSVINALINAMRNRKKVTVILELQASFDEKSNIYWASKLKEEGARVIFGAQDLKVHAKLCMIARREKHNVKRLYFAAGTGNFNEDTARLYTDFLLISSDQKLAKEVEAVFHLLQSGLSDSTKFKNLIVSPLTTRKRFKKMIKRETCNAIEGLDASIDMKINSLSDQEIIDELYAAAEAGVKIRLIVRGMFSIVPDLPELGGNLQAISIVDKYLEHSRIFIFHNGGNEEVYIGSADLLTRNIERRIEAIVPIKDAAIKTYLKEIFEIYWKDTAKARILDHGLSNNFRNGAKPFRSQDAVYDYMRKVHET